jgi:hypothetical protein
VLAGLERSDGLKVKNGKGREGKDLRIKKVSNK